MVNLDIKKLQKIELEILEQFVNICNKEKLQYYVLGGTLIGAIRHKGFIPWDDDVDVCMPRKDYEKFLNVAQKYLPEYYFLQTYITDKEYTEVFAKIRNSKTTFIERRSINRLINHGIYMDVFPLDYYMENRIKAFIFNLYNRMLQIRISAVFNLKNMHYPFYKKIIRRFCSSILKIFYPKIYPVLVKRDLLFKSIKKSRLVANYCGAWGKKEIAPIEWFGKGIDRQFENLIVKVPDHYDKWLTKVYGNYMCLPPKEKQISHHYTDIIDLENPYTKYIKEKK